MAHRFYTSRKRAYRSRRDALATTFQEAYDFLRGLELLCDGDHGFHMGTAQHVQFYLGERFLFHLAIRDTDGDKPWLQLSPRHHGRLKEGAHDAAHLLFRERIHRVLQQLGVPGRAVMRREDAYRITVGTPLTFFRLLQGELFDIVACTDDQPWQQELFADAKRRKKRRRRAKKDPRQGLLLAAQEAEEGVAELVRSLESELGVALTVQLTAEGATITLTSGGRQLRAESLVEAVAALFDVVDGQQEAGDAS